MTPIATKHEFRAPSDIIESERERLGITTPPVELAVSALPLVGTWVNCDHQTRGLVRVMIAASGNEITVHAFGACTPTPCDWGLVKGMIYSANVSAAPAMAFTATYTFAFKQTVIVGHLFNGSLLVETFDHFTDKSGRADYYSEYVMAS
ncbi:MAG TPA: hypothetical protein VHD85_01355 [Terracidiphilus sp.]|jgi:hypothetical protein|nr:hypothetical protein [Terracidiphilus sp.]